jgi:menaquinol-cytochrome c reductase iron-sulfur subunit
MVPDPQTDAENLSRRGFLGWAVGLGTGFVALVVGIPLVRSVVNSVGRAQPGEFIRVADVSAIPTGEPYGITFAETAKDAYNVNVLPHSVYAVKKSDTDITVFSPVCPHLGCQVFFDRQLKEYACPCHGSRFGSDGTRISGPTPRGLDTLPSKIDKGGLYVQWVQYKGGVPEKTPV